MCASEGQCVCFVCVLIIYGYDGIVVDVVAFDCRSGSVGVVVALHAFFFD